MTLSPRGFLTLRAVQAVAILGVVAYAVQGAVPWCRDNLGPAFENWVYPGLILSAGGLCLARAIRTRSERAAWIAIGTGIVLWAGAELYGTLASFPGGSFTAADPMWLAFYPASLIGLHQLVRSRVRRLHAGIALDALIGALGVAAVGAALVFGALLGERAANPQDFPLDAAFFFGDLVLLGAAVAVFALTGWRPGRTIATIASAFAVCAAVDGFSLWQGATGFDLHVTSVFALWPAAALLIGFAAWHRAPARKHVSVAPVEGGRAIALPSVFAVTGLALLTVHAIAPLNALAVGLAVATLAAVIARMAVTLAQHARLLTASRREALTDALTGLGNRRRLMLDLERASEDAAPERPWALLLFDLDGFKQYNDWHGHPAGDELLKALGGRLASAMSEDATAYRLGGDEFCAIVRCQGHTHARRVRAAALKALLDRAGGFEVSSSSGMVMLPADASTSAAVLRIADERLYADKARRRSFSVGRHSSQPAVDPRYDDEPTRRVHTADDLPITPVQPNVNA